MPNLVGAPLFFILMLRRMPAAGVLIDGFLFQSAFGINDASLMPLRQGIEGLYPAAFFQPVLLPGRSCLMRTRHHFPGLADGNVQAVEEGLIVAPLVAAQAFPGGIQEAGMIFVTVLRQHFKLLGRLLLARNQFPQPTSRLVEFHLGKIKYGL